MGLDGVELVLAIEETFGISISDGVAAELATPALVVGHVQRAVQSRAGRRPCLSQRAFHRVRASLCETTKVPRREIQLGTRISRLFSRRERRQQWDAFRWSSELEGLPNLGLGRGVLFPPTRVRDLVNLRISTMSAELRDREDWTDQEVRTVVRHLISTQLGIRKFDDHDEFIRDLGVD